MEAKTQGYDSNKLAHVKFFNSKWWAQMER